MSSKLGLAEIEKKIEDKSVKIGFIGIGTMGSRMASNLLLKGFNIIAYDLFPEKLFSLHDKGALIAKSLEEIASFSDIIITMLPSSKEVEPLMIGEKGLIHLLKPQSIVIDMSTSLPSSTRKISEALIKESIYMLDAPVSGGIKGAEEGTLTIMVGGDKDLYKIINPVLLVMGKKTYYIGENGSGNTMKIMNNMLFSMILSCTCETLVLGKKVGLPPELIGEVVGASSGKSYALNEKIPQFVLKNNFNDGMKIQLMDKDIELAKIVAKEVNLPMPCLNITHMFYKMAIIQGLSLEDCSSIIKVMEKMYNISVVPRN